MSTLKHHGVTTLYGCLAAVVLSLGVAACGSSSSSDSSVRAGGSTDNGRALKAGEPITIGLLQGTDAEGGPLFLHGLQIGQKRVNDAGGVNGHNIDIKVYKTDGTPESVSSAYRAAGRDPKVLAAFLGAGGGLALRNLSSTVKLPAIAATGNDKVGKPATRYMFEEAHAKEYPTSVMQYAMTRYGAKKVAMLHYETDFSQQLAASMKEGCKQMGCEVTDVQSSTSTASVSTLSPLLTRMRASKPDVYYIESLNPNAMKAARSLGLFDKPVIAEQYLTTPALAAACGSACNGVVISAHKCRLSDLNQLKSADPLKPYCEAFHSDFEKMFPGTEFELYNKWGMDAVDYIKTAAKRALDGKSLTRETLVDNLEKLDGSLLTSEGFVTTSPEDHTLYGKYHDAYVATSVGVKGKAVTYTLAPSADPTGVQCPTCQGKG